MGKHYITHPRCYYCQIEMPPLAEYYVMRKAVEPKGVPYRWQNMGECCLTCHDVRDKEICFDPFDTHK